jgi:hypothetical protein
MRISLMIRKKITRKKAESNIAIVNVTQLIWLPVTLITVTAPL